MKKLTALLLALVMIFALAACGTETVTVTGTPEPTAEPTSEPTAEPTAESTSEPTSAPGGEAVSGGAGTGSTLVVYFSATGNTQTAAETIADLTGGDLFQLEPADPYTDEDLNWTDESSRVVQEHDNPEARDVALVADTVDNWEAYDTVFLGYPIWWGIAAWPVDTFVAANDFTGKTVIPFCTSSSSGIGESGQLLADLAGTGDWQEGQRFSSSVDQAEVQDWLEGLSL